MRRMIALGILACFLLSLIPAMSQVTTSEIISNEASPTEEGIVCTTLIDYPENGAWIKSDNAVIRVIGSQNADWYLNAEKFDASQKQVQLLEPGIQRLTAKSSECSQTNEFFVEFQKGEN